MTEYWATQPPGPGAYDLVPYGAPLRPDNRYAWCLVLVPLLYLGLEAALDGTQLDSAAYRPTLIPIVLLVNTALIGLDAIRIRQADIRLSRLVCFCVLVPAYLVVRAMRDSRTYPILVVWVVAFAFSLPSFGVLQTTFGVRLKGVVVERYLDSVVQRGWNSSYSVDCPDHPRLKVGNTFRCRIVGDPVPKDFIEVRLTTSGGHYTACIVNANGGQESRHCFT